MLIRWWKWILVCLSFLGIQAHAITVKTPQAYIHDFAHVLSPPTRQSLETDLRQFEKQTSHQIAVVTVSNLQGKPIETLANQRFREWGIGQASKNNGVLFLIAIQERQMRFEVGYGLEGALTDLQSDSIQEEIIKTYFLRGNFQGGIQAGVQKIKQAIGREIIPDPPTHTNWFQRQREMVTAKKRQLQMVILQHRTQSIILSALGIILIWICLLAPTEAWWPGGIAGGFVGALFFTFVGVSWKIIPFAILVGWILDYVISKQPLVRWMYDRWGWLAGVFIGSILGTVAALVSQIWLFLPIAAALGALLYVLSHSKYFWKKLAELSLWTIILGIMGRLFKALFGGVSDGGIFKGGSSGGGGASTKW